MQHTRKTTATTFATKICERKDKSRKVAER